MELPAGVEAQLNLPADWGNHLLRDDKPIAIENRNGVISIQVEPGMHAIVIGGQTP